MAATQSKPHRSTVLRLICTLAFGCCLTAVCQACPTCKEGIADGPNHLNMIRGYFWSIIFMMSMPFMIFGSLAVYFYSMARKNRNSPAAPVTRESFNDFA